MQRRAVRLAIGMGIVVAGGLGVWAQAPTAQTPKPDPSQSTIPVAPQSSPATAPPASANAAGGQAAPPVQSGGTLHGVVKSGTTPLPGVTVTAQNTLTGKKYSTTTDTTGAWSLTIPQNGRYVIRKKRE